MDHVIITTLQEIGLNEKEAHVYLAMLELGESSIIPIAKQAGVKRTTVYNYLEEFTQKGLISMTVRNGRRYYIANSPNRLRLLIKERAQKVESIVPQLFSLFKEGETKPSVQMFEGIEGIKAVFDLSLETENKKIDVIPIESAGHVFVGPEYIADYVEAAKRRGITFRSLRLATDDYDNYRLFMPQYNDHREIKVAPDWFKPESYIQIYDNKVGVFSRANEVPYAMIITSLSFSQTMRQFFETIWQQSVPIKKWLKENRGSHSIS